MYTGLVLEFAFARLATLYVVRDAHSEIILCFRPVFRIYEKNTSTSFCTAEHNERATV